MTIKVGMVTFDCRDARALAEWWARQTGGTVGDDYDGLFVQVSNPDGGPALGFQQVPDPTPGKNRLHLDLSADNREDELARLRSEGALEVARHELPGFSWVVMADPEGNQFCVA